MSSKFKGFTLIEALIVMAIIGILSAIAVPAYQGYIANANMVRVNTHYEEAVRFLRNELRRIEVQVSIGGSLGDLLQDNDSLIATLNAMGGKSPTGKAAFADEASSEDGVIGVSGADPDSVASYSVTLTRPAYTDLTEVTEVLRYAE